MQQIPLMGLIYTHATNTLVWLGTDNDCDPVLAFNAMETVYARLQGTEAQVTPADFTRLDIPTATDRSWWAIRQLFRRPWLTRLWTIQEAVLSRFLFIGCGEAQASWDDFAAWCYYLQETGLLDWLAGDNSLDSHYSSDTSLFSTPPVGATVVNSIQTDRFHTLTLVAKDYLLSILVSTRYAQATELKDKIYGVLGMADADIIPDYSPDVSAREVFHRACLTQLPLLVYELLSCVDHAIPLSPSWIPDWSIPRTTEALGYLTKAWTLYCTGGQPTATQRAKVDFNSDSTEMTLSGKVFDTIARLGCISYDPILDIDNPPLVNQYLASYTDIIRTLADDYMYPVPATSTYEAFFQTLLAGRDSSGSAPPSADHSEVFSLILDSTTGQMPSLPGQVYTVRRRKGFFNLNSLRSRKPAKTLDDLRTAIRAALKMRRFAITKKGYFALVPRGAQEGDTIVVLDKACVPFVVRWAGSTTVERRFELLGEAYVHGIMKGEAMTMENINLEDITLI